MILPYENGKPKLRSRASICHALNPNANTKIRSRYWTSRISPREEAAAARGMEEVAVAGTTV